MPTKTSYKRTPQKKCLILWDGHLARPGIIRKLFIPEAVEYAAMIHVCIWPLLVLLESCSSCTKREFGIFFYLEVSKIKISLIFH